MKRKIVFIVLLSIVLIVCFAYLQYGRSSFVNHITSQKESNGYTVSLNVTVNKLWIGDKEKVSQQLIQSIVNNEFENVDFSYDISGYPNEVTMKVYTNSFTYALNKPAIQVRYAPQSEGDYNIKEHPEKFVLTYKK